MTVQATITDFLQTTVGNQVVINQGVWVRLHNNNLGTDTFSSGITGSLGQFTYTVVPGDYSLFWGPSATVGGTPNLANSHYRVAYSAGDDAALDSVTASSSGPYVKYPGAVAGSMNSIAFAPAPSGDATGVTDAAAILAALQALDAAGGGIFVLNPTFAGAPYYYTNIFHTPTNSLWIWAYGAQMLSTLGKTSGTKAFWIQVAAGKTGSIRGGTWDYTVAVNIDTDSFSRSATGDTLAITGVDSAHFGGYGEFVDCVVNNSRNTSFKTYWLQRASVIRPSSTDSLGNGVFCSDIVADLLIDGPVIIRAADDSIAVVSDANLAALCKRVKVTGWTCVQTYGNFIDFTGVDGGYVGPGHGDTSWASGINIHHDSLDSLGTCKNIEISDEITLKNSGTYFGIGQFKTSVNTGNDFGIYIHDDVDQILLGNPTITGSQAAGLKLSTTGNVRRKSLPVGRVTSGTFLRTPGTSGSGTVVMTANRMTAIPVIVGELDASTAISINVHITSVGALNSVIRLGIYNDLGDGFPNALVVDAGTVDGHAATGVITVVISQALTPGIYWLVAVGQGAPATQPTVNALTNSAPFVGFNQDPATNINGYFQDGVTGALPNPFVVGGNTASGVALTLGF